MMTKVVSLPENIGKNLISLRDMSVQEWFPQYGSGTLSKSGRCGALTRDMAYEERVAWEYGYEFISAPASRVLIGPMMAESNDRVVTEGAWHCERLTARSLGDVFELAHIRYSPPDSPTVEGRAIVVTQTTWASVRSGHIIFAFIESSTGEPINPC